MYYFDSKKYLILSFLVILNWMNPSYATHGEDQIEKFRAFLRDLGVEASIHEGESAALAQVMESNCDSVSDPEDAEFVNILKAERAISSELGKIFRQELDKALSVPSSKLGKSMVQSCRVNSSLDGVGHRINRTKKREMFWSAMHSLAEQLSYVVDDNLRFFQENDAARIHLIWLLKHHLYLGLIYGHSKDLVGVRSRLEQIRLGRQLSGVISGPGFPPLNLKKIELFFEMTTVPGDLRAEDYELRFTLIEKVLGSSKLTQSFSSVDAFGHPALASYWEDLKWRFELFRRIKAILDAESREFAINRSSMFDVVSPIYRYQDERCDQFSIKLAKRPIVGTEDIQAFADALSLEECPAEKVYRDAKVRIRVVIYPSLMRLLEFVQSKALSKGQKIKDTTGAGGSGAEGDPVLSPGLVPSITATKLGDLPSELAEDAASEVGEAVIPQLAALSWEPKGEIAPMEPTSSPRDQGSKASITALPLTDRPRKAVLLTGKAAQLFYATGLTSRVSGYRVPTFNNSDFFELLRQLGTGDSRRETGNGSSISFEVPSLVADPNIPGPRPNRTFKIHLAHSGRDELPLATIRRFLGSALEIAGLGEDTVDLELP